MQGAGDLPQFALQAGSRSLSSALQVLRHCLEPTTWVLEAATLDEARCISKVALLSKDISVRTAAAEVLEIIDAYTKEEGKGIEDS